MIALQGLENEERRHCNILRDFRWSQTPLPSIGCIVRVANWIRILEGKGALQWNTSYAYFPGYYINPPERQQDPVLSIQVPNGQGWLYLLKPPCCKNRWLDMILGKGIKRLLFFILRNQIKDFNWWQDRWTDLTLARGGKSQGLSL